MSRQLRYVDLLRHEQAFFLWTIDTMLNICSTRELRYPVLPDMSRTHDPLCYCGIFAVSHESESYTSMMYVLISSQTLFPTSCPHLKSVEWEGIEPTISALSEKCLNLLGHHSKLVWKMRLERTIPWSQIKNSTYWTTSIFILAVLIGIEPIISSTDGSLPLSLKYQSYIYYSYLLRNTFRINIK